MGERPTSGPTSGTGDAALPPPPRATAMIVIGMAGSGKSTLVAKLASHLGLQAQAAAAGGDDAAPPRAARPYVINIDPAVSMLGYAPNVDIRDTVDYTRVMDEYKLGPNGGILTSLNLFTTKFDQVLQLVEKRASELDHVILDTPGQIEIFTWSASGSIITDSLASALPTVLVYVVDTPRTTAPATFMSNMLYACSIMYKSRLPFVLAFNKTDVQSHQFAMDWMHDFEKFQQALMAGHARDPSAHAVGPDTPAPAGTFESRGEEPSYMNSLMNSMSLVLDEFYQQLRAVGVSSATGEGIDDLLRAVDEARQEYLADYRPQLEAMLKDKLAQRQQSQSEQMSQLMHDMSLRDQRSGLAKVRARQRAGLDDIEPAYDGDGDIVDPDTDEEKPEYGAPGGDERLQQKWNTLDGSYWPTPQPM